MDVRNETIGIELSRAKAVLLSLAKRWRYRHRLTLVFDLEQTGSFGSYLGYDPEKTISRQNQAIGNHGKVIYN